MALKFNPFTGTFDYTGSGGGSSSVPMSRTAFVDIDSGNDTSGTVGLVNKPFATIAAAETAITDATIDKIYQLHLGPGKHDIIGLTKKSYISWAGQGVGVTSVYTSDTSTFSFTNSGMNANIHTYQMAGISFICPTSMDLYSIGGTGRLNLIFIDMTFQSSFNAVGRGGEDNILHFGYVDYNDGFDITSMSLSGGMVSTEGETWLRADHGNGAQMTMSGTKVLGTLNIISVDGTSLVVAAIVGGFVGGSGLVVDGAAAQVYIDDSAVISGSVTLNNSASILYLSNSNFTAYTPDNSSLWNTVPATVKSALDYVATGEVHPSKWIVSGMLTASSSATDAGAIAGQVSASSHTTVDGSDTTIGIQGVASAVIDSGATNDKAIAGVFGTTTRGNGSDDGTLHEMDGAYALMFHNSGAAGTTEKVVTVGSTLIHQQGAITNLYDLKPESVPAGTGTVGTHYGVYVEQSPFGGTKQNWISGSTLVGGGGFTTPVEALEIVGNEKISGSILDSASTISVHVNNRQLLYPSGVTSLDWLNMAFYRSDGTASIDYGNGYLIDSAGNPNITYQVPGVVTLPSADFAISSAGRGLQIKEGSDAKMGTATLVAGTVTVATAAVHTTSRVFVSSNSASTLHGSLWVENIIEATSFDINSTSITDDSTVAWMIVDPSA